MYSTFLIVHRNNLAHSNQFYGLRIHPEYYQMASNPCSAQWNLKPARFEGLIGYKNGVNCVVATQVSRPAVDGSIDVQRLLLQFADCQAAYPFSVGQSVSWSVRQAGSWGATEGGEGERSGGASSGHPANSQSGWRLIRPSTSQAWSGDSSELLSAQSLSRAGPRLGGRSVSHSTT